LKIVILSKREATPIRGKGMWGAAWYTYIHLIKIECSFELDHFNFPDTKMNAHQAYHLTDR